jgi:D-inositol-3-phosphate glycosyltransferase
MTMRTSSVAEESPVKVADRQDQRMSNSSDAVEIALLTGCQDRPYAFGLTMALVSRGVHVDVIGGDGEDSPEFHTTRNLRFLNFRGSQDQKLSFSKKLSHLLRYYARLMGYGLHRQPKILHILWNNKFEYFDRTLLMLYYKLLGKKIAFTVHNVNQAKRDQKDSVLNRATLKVQYLFCDHFFVHTQKMKAELCDDFAVAEKKVTVIRHPINNAFPDTALTPSEAKKRLGVKEDEQTILFFGRMRPYKGIEHLLTAFKQLSAKHPKYRLIIAGEPKKGSEAYLDEIRTFATIEFKAGELILDFRFIPDEEMEVYLKGSDVLVLPYKDIFQSGVLFLAYSFGLPVVATDVGSFREEIVDGKTGFICKPGDPADLAKTLETYFLSDIYTNLRTHRQDIKDYANTVHSWDTVAELTRKAYVAISGAQHQ